MPLEDERGTRLSDKTLFSQESPKNRRKDVFFPGCFSLAFMTMRLGGVWLDCKTAGRGSSTFPAPAAERPPLGGGRPVPGHPEGEGRCGEGLAQRYTGEGARSPKYTSLVLRVIPSGSQNLGSRLLDYSQKFGCTSNNDYFLLTTVFFSNSTSRGTATLKM